MDTEAMTADYADRLSGGKAGRKDAIDAGTFEPLPRNRTIKNGSVMTILEYGTMNAQMEELRRHCQALIAAIDAQTRRG